MTDYDEARPPLRPAWIYPVGKVIHNKHGISFTVAARESSDFWTKGPKRWVKTWKGLAHPDWAFIALVNYGLYKSAEADYEQSILDRSKNE